MLHRMNSLSGDNSLVSPETDLLRSYNIGPGSRRSNNSNTSSMECISNVIGYIGTSCSNPFHILLIMRYHLDMHNPLNQVSVTKKDWPVATADNGKEFDITLVRT